MENMEQKYIAQMEEIKRRVESIEKIVEVSTGQLYLPVVTESVYLQFRKILELIAMSSLMESKQTTRNFGNKVLCGRVRIMELLNSHKALNRPDFSGGSAR